MTTPEQFAYYVAAALQMRVDELEAALEKMTAPMRPDGSWNFDREACRQIALEALGRS